MAQPRSLDVPARPDMPQMSVLGVPDAVPDTSAIRDDPGAAPATADDVQDVSRATEQPAPEPAAQDSVAPDAASDDPPALPAPSLDLSLPPDLTDLRAMERD